MFETLNAIDPAVALQMTPGPGGGPGALPGVNPVTQLVWNALGAFVVTLVVDAILVAVAEEYTVARMTDVLEDPVG